MYKRPGTLWIKVGTDLFEIDDRNYLIISDYFSRNPVVKELPTTIAGTVITATKETVSILDVPCEVVSDNGPQFFHRYNYLCSQWNIKHTTSSPLYPQSNGFIEKQIPQTNHQEMHHIKRRCQQSVTQRPIDTTRHCVTQSSRTDISTTNDNICSMSCSDGTRRVP